MPGPRRSLGEYLADRSQQFGSLGGLVVDVTVIEFEGIEEATISATVMFGEDNVRQLTAFEHVRMSEDGRPYRAKYGYRCFYRDQLLFGYDRDYERHLEMPHHKHLPGRDDRVPWDRMTLHDVVDELWSYSIPDEEASADPVS